MEIRSYLGTDEPELLEVWNASMTADKVSETIFRTRVLLDPNFASDNLLVAVEAGRVVGFVLAITRQVPLFLQGLEPDQAWVTAFGVHPAYRHRGIGTALLQQTLERLRAQGRVRVAISPYVPNYFAPGVDVDVYADANALLAKLGFEVIEEPISMWVDLSRFQIPADILELERQREAEDGVTIRPVAAADLPELMPFIVRHFGWDWFRHAQDYLLDLFGGRDPHHVCFLVARRHGQIVGYCQQRLERFGPFGIDPAYRNLGIGRLLLFRCLYTMSTRHTYYAYFLWTGDDAARLYSLAGFRQRRAYRIWQKAL